MLTTYLNNIFIKSILLFIAVNLFTATLAQQQASIEIRDKRKIVQMEPANFLQADIKKVESAQIIIQYETAVTTNIKADIYDGYGNIIHHLEYVIEPGSNEMTHKLPGLESGKYFYSMFYGNQNKTFEFRIKTD